MPISKTQWSSDVFLDALRDHSDPLADHCVDVLPREESLAFLFTKLHSAATEPAVLPSAFVDFCRDARESLDLSDLSTAEQEQVARGQRVFMTTTMPVALVLLAKSLQEGYQAPRLGKVLMISGELEASTYRRVLGVLQMLISVCTPGSYTATATSEVLPASDAALTAVKIRLMHAGLRRVAHAKFPEFARNHGGEPLSLEDMLATLIAFSSLVIDGLETLKVPMSDEDAEAYHAIWRLFARCMGIHPPGEPKSFAWIPANIAEAREFYAAYSRRHYAIAATNEEGVLLAAANLKMLSRKMPPLAARIYMRALMGPKASDALGIRAVRLMFIWKWWLLNFPRVWMSLWRVIDRVRADGVTRHIDLSQSILQRLIVLEYKNQVPALRLPRDESEIRQVVRGTSGGLDFGRQQFRTEVFPKELDDLITRRAVLNLDASALKGPPSTKQGLVGLALSGGGIRSAAFCLGAVQALARHRYLRFVDYLSTVSGGGYIGAAISSLLNSREAGPEGQFFPLNSEPGEVEPPAMRHLRSGSDYLGGDGFVQSLRLPVVLLRGIMLNTLLFIPYMMLAALVTWILFPVLKTAHLSDVLFWGTLLIFLVVVSSYPAVTWVRGRFGIARTWQQRNRTEVLQAFTLLAFVGALIFSMALNTIDWALASSWTTARSRVTEEIVRPAEWTDAWKWAIVAVVGLALLNVRRASKSLTRWSNRLLIYAVGMLGYGVMLAMYLVMLLLFVRTPFLPPMYENVLNEAAAAHQKCPTCPTRLDAGLLDELSARGVGFAPDRATVSGTEYGPWTITQPAYDRAGPPFTVEISKSWGLLEVAGMRFGQQSGDWWFAGIAVLFFLLNTLWVDINITSAHGYFRDRLSRVFLIRASWFGKTSSNDQLKLSELASENPGAPYHLVNTALNLAGSKVEDLPGRRSDFFMLSKRYVGSYATGYAPTPAVEKLDAQLNLGTAMAISAAAAAPNAGTTTIKPLVFLLTFLNVRLGYWLPNPWYVQATQRIRRLMVRARPGPWYLMREALGLLDATSAFVNISDGGHMENLAIYELLRRRCKLIIAVDAECDPSMTCPSLATVIRYAQIDLGIQIDIDLSAFPARADGTSKDHWTVGTIDYGGGESGQLLYVKSSLTGDDEPPYVTDYRRKNVSFPHESTADQFFGEAQFESYRALGFHAMNKALRAVGDASSTDVRAAQLETVRGMLS